HAARHREGGAARDGDPARGDAAARRRRRVGPARARALEADLPLERLAALARGEDALDEGIAPLASRAAGSDVEDDRGAHGAGPPEREAGDALPDLLLPHKDPKLARRVDVVAGLVQQRIAAAGGRPDGLEAQQVAVRVVALEGRQHVEVAPVA